MQKSALQSRRPFNTHDRANHLPIIEKEVSDNIVEDNSQSSTTSWNRYDVWHEQNNAEPAESIQLQSESAAATTRKIPKPRARYGSHDRSFTIYETKSEMLITALGDCGRNYEIPKRYSHKADLSWFNPTAIASGARPSKLGRNPRDYGTSRQASYTQCPSKDSLQSLLALYIKHVTPIIYSNEDDESFFTVQKALDRRLLYVFHDKRLAFLRTKGYDIEDLLSWTWILTSSSAERAAMRLTALSKYRGQNAIKGEPIPAFVFIFLLRHQNMNARALRLLIGHGWDRLLYQKKSEAYSNSNLGLANESIFGVSNVTIYGKMSEPTILVMAVRLIRRARVVWPAALLSIAAMITKFVDGGGPMNSSSKGRPRGNTRARLTFIYNTVLSLLGSPSSLLPYQSVIYHQQAQFHVLRRMLEFQPALDIDREGYRAMVRVQLAHKKTSGERRWAEMKAKSWPPWKEEKLGIDRDVGIEHGRSRASEIILRSKEAGYAVQDWENIAEVLAGWDTDHSPTIQSRALVSRARLSRAKTLPTEASASNKVQASLWAARIHATRTLDEAWACFLTYKKQGAMQLSQAPYLAMFEKILSDSKRLKLLSYTSHHKLPQVHDGSDLKPLPGDGKETSPAPGPREAIYVRTPAPDMEQFFELMVNDEIRPSGKLLEFLLKHTMSYRAGIRYLKNAAIPLKAKKSLLDRRRIDDCIAELHAIEDRLFAAYIGFLARFAHQFQQKIHTINLISLQGTYPRPRLNPLMHAFQLMSDRKPLYRPPWNFLLSTLASRGIVVDNISHSCDQNIQDVLSWGVICRVLDQMKDLSIDVDVQAFQILCHGLEKAVFASKKVLQAFNKGFTSVHQTEAGCQGETSDDYEFGRSNSLDAKYVLSQGLPLLKSWFRKIVDLQSTAKESTTNRRFSNADDQPRLQEEIFGPVTLLPRTQEMLHSAQIHAFIRAMGFCSDYDGILELLRWMRQYEPELRSVADESLNGMRLTRRCIIAIRVFVEHSWVYHDLEQTKDQYTGEGAGRKVIQEVFDVIEGSPDWGGWPTDEEVKEYCRKDRIIVYHD